MTKWGLWVVLVVAVAAYGCDTANGGPIGEGGSGGDGGAAGDGGSAGEGGSGGDGGAAGEGGAGGGGGVGGSAGAGGGGGVGGSAGAGGGGGVGGSAGAGGAGGSAGAGGAGGSAGAGGAGGSGGMPITASSCLDLFNDGVGDNGTYTVNLPGVGDIEVYCDMTTPPGGWTQLYDQDVTVLGGYLSPAAVWTNGVTNTPPDGGQYSILQLTSEFNQGGDYEFLMDWNDRTNFVRWTQSEDPFVGRGDVTIVAQSPIDQVGCGPFGGLAADGDVSSAMDGDPLPCWWWAIGTSAAYAGGIPGYANSGEGTSLVATRTRLWVR